MLLSKMPCLIITLSGHNYILAPQKAKQNDF